MEKLHADIVDNILDRLPIETVLAAKQVCQPWRILLRSKTDKVGLLFVQLYYDENGDINYCGDQFDLIHGKMMKYNYSYHIIDDMHNYTNSIPGYKPIDFYMLGSCNGLVCFQRRCNTYLGEPFLICNPVTREVVHVPKTNTYTPADMAYKMVIGFGYCHSTNEYKIVRMYKDPRKTHVQVYTIGVDNEWRNKDESIDISDMDSRIGIYANGALHWYKDRSIIAFGLEDETFRLIPLPRFEDINNNRRLKLLGGNNLYLVYTIYNKHCMDIWEYRSKNTNTGTNGCENYKDENSWHWMKKFSIDQQKDSLLKDVLCFDPLAITRCDEVILLCNYMTLYCYDLKTSTMKQLLDGREAGFYVMNVIPHANTIVSMSLKDLEEVQDR